MIHRALLSEDYSGLPHIYAESNGIPGLQRHDVWCTDEDESGNMYTEETADTIIF